MFSQNIERHICRNLTINPGDLAASTIYPWIYLNQQLIYVWKYIDMMWILMQNCAFYPYAFSKESNNTVRSLVECEWYSTRYLSFKNWQSHFCKNGHEQRSEQMWHWIMSIYLIQFWICNRNKSNLVQRNQKKNSSNFALYTRRKISPYKKEFFWIFEIRLWKNT